MTLATHEEVIEPEIVLSFAEHVEAVSGHHESFKFHRGKTVESAILTGQALSSAKADLPRGKWEKFLARVDMSRQYAHRFMQVGENLNVHNCGQLPKAVAALYELSRLDPSDIEDGIESGAITPDMKIKEAKAFARSDWPVVPEPTPEEQLRRFEETRERLVEQGVLPPRRTQEEEDAAADEFVESLVGSRRSTPSGTDQRTRHLNAVGELLASNEPINTDGLTANGLRAAQLLGLA